MPVSLSLDDVDRLEFMIPLSQVPKMFPRLRNGKCINLATIYRWTNEGCEGVKLEYRKLGSTRCDSGMDRHSSAG